MINIPEILHHWNRQLPSKISVGGMIAKNPVAHKWRAPYRSLVLRETLCWRIHDLLTQAQFLYEANHILGSRILIRSALESVAILIHLNQLTAQVLDRSLNFHEFQKKTLKLLVGSRDRSTNHESINIVTVFKHCEKIYKGITEIYATLSECAHPNYEGVCLGYSETDEERHVTKFANKWQVMFADKHVSLVEFVSRTFEKEYTYIWVDQLHKLETWLVENDAELMATIGEGERPLSRITPPI